jgi:endo-1,4-beta-xylanase
MPVPVHLATTALLLALVAACPTSVAHAGDAPCTLRAVADLAGVHVGAAFVVGREFSSVTAPLYWSETQPTAGQYDFTVADEAVGLGEAHGQRVRGHPLVWGRLALPAYVTQVTDPAALRALVAERIATVVGRYAGRIAQYDVVNEPLTLFGAAGTTDGLDDNHFLRVLGPGYIRAALEAAHAADPAAQLFINDFLVEVAGAKQDRLFTLAQDLLAAGAPLHGIGLQGHLRFPLARTLEPTAAEIEATVRRFAALGLTVEITEVDVTLSSRHPCLLEFQRRAYDALVAGCAAVPACTGVTTWGITDRFTWIKNFFGIDGAPLLFDEAYARKPAYFGVRDALVRAACPEGGGCGLDCVLDDCAAAGVCPEEPPADCCDVSADCAADVCTTRTCDDHVCGAALPAVCDDGDPCTADACAAPDGCRNDPIVGFEAAGCVCRRPDPAACAGQPLPADVGERVERACGFIDAAREAVVTRQAKRLLRKAGRQLRRARGHARRAARRGLLSAECVASLVGELRDARRRTVRVRRGLRG